MHQTSCNKDIAGCNTGSHEQAVEMAESEPVCM